MGGCVLCKKHQQIIVGALIGLIVRLLECRSLKEVKKFSNTFNSILAVMRGGVSLVWALLLMPVIISGGSLNVVIDFALKT